MQKIKSKKILIIIFILILLNLSLIYIKGNTLEYSEREKYLISLYKEKKLLVLTFDDGPSKYTNKLLDVLKEYNVHATFFILGEQAEKYSDSLKKEYEDGNLICIHSYTHRFFTKIPSKDVVEQIDKTRSVIQKLTEYTPKYIRVPYGIINDNVENILKEEKLENVLWTVDSLDWKYKEKNATVEHIKKTTSGNDIILMHDILQSSIDAAQEIIIYYKNLGYEFVTIEEFTNIKNIIKDEN